ncbi:MAG TPA: dTMP kinase [Candidatus Paceibacterota bacterium]|jgi:dTMP kinase|nr:dTMP kinase [Candidatus Paceibacterota bacterium]
MKPQFIVIEGGEGSGKSTLVRVLKESLGDAVTVTREPGGSPYAELIRTAAIKNPLAKDAPPETTLCLMFAARFDNVANIIIPSLKKGIPVIADRFDGSSYAYQISSQSSLLEDLFWSMRGKLMVTPDLYVFVDVDPEEGLKRARGRNQSLDMGKQYDHFDDREVVFHQNVRKGYLKFFEKIKESGTPYIVVDANRPLETVKRDFLVQMKKQLGIK